MKLAKASLAEVDALLNLMRVLNTCDDNGIPCKPDGTWEEGEDMEWFDSENPEHLRKFYGRVMGCFKDHPGGLSRTVGGYHLAMTNDVFDPNSDVYEWHPDLIPAVAARNLPKQSLSASQLIDAVRNDLANYHSSDDDRIAIAMSRIDDWKRGRNDQDHRSLREAVKPTENQHGK